MAAAMLIGSVPMSAFAADTNDSSGSNADVASTGTEMELFGHDLEVKVENRTDVFDMKYKR